MSDLKAALAELPLFPLPQVVLFPGAVLPLHVFEPRYRQMLKDCVAAHGAMAVVLVRNPEAVDEHGHPAIAEVAGAGVVIEHQPLADGRSNILVHGSARVRLEELPFVAPYRRARATILEEVDIEPPAADRAALVSAATALATEVKKRNTKFNLRLPANATAGTLADLCAHHLIVDAGDRQAILEELNVRARVQRVIRELAVLRRTIGGDVAGGMLN